MGGGNLALKIPENQGQCEICGQKMIPAPKQGLGVCLECVNPEQTSIYCTTCQERTYLDDSNEAEKVWEFLSKLPGFPQITDRKGVILRGNMCGKCFSPGSDKKLEIYIIRVVEKIK
jgi:hypothetical protein